METASTTRPSPTSIQRTISSRVTVSVHNLSKSTLHLCRCYIPINAPTLHQIRTYLDTQFAGTFLTSQVENSCIRMGIEASEVAVSGSSGCPGESFSSDILATSTKKS